MWKKFKFMDHPTENAPCRAASNIFRLLTPLCALAGGVLYAASLPPFNLGFAVLIALLPLFFTAENHSAGFRFFNGWLWGWGWAFFSCRFLREIHPAVPFLIAPVLGLWPGFYTFALGWFIRKIKHHTSLAPYLQELLFWLLAAALFTVIEWSRCRLFVWNDLSVTMWKFPLAMQIARLTGRYGVTFILVAGAGGFYALRRKKNGLPAAAAALLLWLAALSYGAVHLYQKKTLREPVTFHAGLIQGNMPQMRNFTDAELVMAVNTYSTMTAKLLSSETPHAVFWPECAVPIPLRSSAPMAGFYRRALAPLLKVPLLIGTLDFPFDGTQGMTNSALLINTKGAVAGKYDKFHRVPFGEYVPFREYLPEFMIEAFDMGRDLTGGRELLPIEIIPGIRAGVVICYEGVFSYVTAGLARNNANILVALSNDVWYPRSSEPEQHLANAVMRAVETGMPMIRCGNNGGSGVVSPQGVFQQYIGSDSPRPELLRESAAGVVSVTVEKFPQKTPFVRWGNYLPLMFALILLATFPALVRRKKSGTF